MLLCFVLMGVAVLCAHVCFHATVLCPGVC